MSKKKNKFSIEKLLTYKDLNDENILESPFTNDRQRIKYMAQAYKHMSIAKSFSVFYGIEISPEVKQNKSINTVNIIEVGKVYYATVKQITKNYTTFEIPGVKEELISRENLMSCRDYIDLYLAQNDNKILIEVREHRQNEFVVSVINAYYRVWVNYIEKAIQHEDPIMVHIDELVKGGYICHTNIDTLNALTGKTYTSSVFIPGSHIVLNIEHDFEKWIGQDVEIIPQKFGKFRDQKTGLSENSIVGSRKRVLQIEGNNNIYELWEQYQTQQKLAELAGKSIEGDILEGTVTGIINSNKKTGIFVELNDKFITGLLPLDDAIDLLNYKPGDPINVRITEFEQQEGKDPFVFNKKHQVVKANVRPIFELA